MDGAIPRDPRGPTARFAAAALCAALVACAPAPPVTPVVTVAVGPTTAPLDPPTPSDRLLALLTEDNPRLERVAMSLAGVGDAADLRAAGVRLVALARAVGTDAWRQADRARILEEVAGTTEGAAPLMTSGQLEARETRALTAILAAMSHVGGSSVIAYAFALAEDEAAAWDRRRLALRVLDRVVAARDAPSVARRAQIAARLPPPRAPFTTAAELVSHLRYALRRCYQRALQRDPALHVRARLTLRHGPRGEPSAAFEGDPLPPELERCLADAVKGPRAQDRELWGTQFTFVLMPP